MGRAPSMRAWVSSFVTFCMVRSGKPLIWYSGSGCWVGGDHPRGKGKASDAGAYRWVVVAGLR